MTRMLAIECATEVCSLALFEDGLLVAHRHEVLGRGHAEHLVPMIAALPGKGHAQEIWVSLGPGSFTGVRIGLAAARALGLAWGAAVHGFPTLALVAASSGDAAAGPVSVCNAGGHGEWFVQNFAADFTPEGSLASLAPADAVAFARHRTLVGNRAAELAELAGDGRTAIETLPDAQHVTRLPLFLLTTELAPLYGRGPDARPRQ